MDEMAADEVARLASQVAALPDGDAVAVVDDTIFSGLTMRAVLTVLLPRHVRRLHAFCLRAVLVAAERMHLVDHGRRHIEEHYRRRQHSERRPRSHTFCGKGDRVVTDEHCDYFIR